MARLVVPKRGSGRLAAKDASELDADDFKDRLVKYIPAESVALYTFADRMLISYYGIDSAGVPTTHAADAVMYIGSWGLFALAIIGTPLYLRRQKLVNQPWKVHAAIATLAFAAWAYTIGGSVILLNHWYHPLAAALSAPVFTFVAGLIEPKAA